MKDKNKDKTNKTDAKPGSSTQGAQQAPPEVVPIKARVRVSHRDPRPGGGFITRLAGAPLEVMPNIFTSIYYEKLTDEEYKEAIKKLKKREG